MKGLKGWLSQSSACPASTRSEFKPQNPCKKLTVTAHYEPAPGLKGYLKEQHGTLLNNDLWPSYTRGTGAVAQSLFLMCKHKAERANQKRHGLSNLVLAHTYTYTSYTHMNIHICALAHMYVRVHTHTHTHTQSLSLSLSMTG